MPPPGALTKEQMLQAQSSATPTTVSAPLAGSLTQQQMLQTQSAPQEPEGVLGAVASKSEEFGKWAVKSFQKGVEQPLISVAATPVQLLAKITGQPDPFASGLLDTNPATRGLSVAPITPSGMFQKLGQTASLGLLALSPEATGALKLGALGAAQGAANSVAAGNTGASEISDDAIQGALFGGTLGLLGNAARVAASAEKSSSGVNQAMETELARIRPVTLSRYINTAVESAEDYHAPSVDTMLGNDIQKGANILITKVIPQAGKALDEAHAASAGIPIQLVNEGSSDAVGSQAIPALRDDINNVMQRMTGHQFSDYASEGESGLKINNYPQGAGTEGLDTEAGAVSALPGRSIELAPGDRKALEYVDGQLKLLENSPTVQTASDILKNLDSKINWDRPQFGPGSSPVDGFLRYARGAINRTIAPGAPELAEANHAWGALQEVKNSVADAAGKDLDHINLLARRVLYRGEEGKAQNVLDTLFSVVKPYLPAGEESYTTKAIIARYARDTFGGVRSESGLTQSMSSGDAAGLASGYTSRVVGAALRAGKKFLSPDAQEYAMSIAKGEPYSFVPGMHNIDKFLDSSSGNKILEGFKQGLRAIGVSSNNVSKAAVNTLKMMLLTNGTQPAAVPLPPQNASQAPAQPQAMSQPQGRTLSIAQPAQKATNQVAPATTGQQYASQARSLSDFGMNMRGGGGLSLS